MKGVILSAAVLGAVLLSGQSAAAGEHVATRCDWRGCSHIVCNHTGDRCHRYYSDGYSDSYYRRPYRYDGYYGEGYGRDREDRRYDDCDRDAGRCDARGDYDDDWDD